MCGIAGYIPTPAPGTAPGARLSDPEPRLARALDAIAHRGPDGQGTQRDPGTGVALGHVRLSIIDLSGDGAQPMCNEDASVWITYNGEVYNYPALRDELIALGHTFKSHTDTETLVHGYEAWGLTGLIDRLRGMFAFALFDKAKGVVHLARDHFGIKPLFYRQDKSGIVFASEPKAIAAFDGKPLGLAPGALVDSLHHMAVPSPGSIYADIKQILPAQSLTLSLGGEDTQSCIHWSWSPAPARKASREGEAPAEPQTSGSARLGGSLALPKGSTKQAASRVWEAIVKSVERHLIADVPVGVFLSAGLDSSLIAAACAELGRKPTCLTIAIDDPQYDESPIAAELCKRYGFEHWVHPMGRDACKKWNDQLGKIYDEPFTASAALTALEVCAVAATRFKVMLSGDGGDEVFGGYEWYTHWLDAYGDDGRGRSVVNQAFHALREMMGKNAIPADPIEGYAQMLGGFSQREIASLFANPVNEDRSAGHAYGDIAASIREKNLSGFDRMQAMDMSLFLPDVCLAKMDRASMHHSLEVRVPLLDRDLAELVAGIDWRTRNPNNELKGLLKQIAHDKLPEAILNKKKQGFSVRTRDWFPQAMIVADIQRDMREGDWWQKFFHPQVDRGVTKLRGRKAWRFWQTWRWVKQHANPIAPSTPRQPNRLQDPFRAH